MKIKAIFPYRQVCLAVLVIIIAAACEGKKEENPIIPPPTSPLSQAHIGYGVINVSYTRVSSQPDEDSASPGYLRQGAIVRIRERRLFRTAGKNESWVLVDGVFSGWLRETLVDIYGNEEQAMTASKSMGR